MSNFDWISDEDRHWEPEPPKEPEHKNRLSRWLVLFLLVVALVVAGAVMVYRQADERISAAEASVQADILAAHQLMLEAGMAGDVDLFRAGLSGRQEAWTAAQIALLEDGAMWERAAFGLTLLGDVGQSPPTVEVSSDLRQAVVTYGLSYQVGDGVMDLRHTAVYRRGANRWLLAPPEGDFWGSWVTNRGSFVTLIYPQRDAAMGERLAFDLDRTMRRLCAASFSFGCLDGLNVSVRLSTQPDSLKTLFDTKSLLQNPRQLNLPAPTLLGIPTDEAGYKLLADGYAAQIALAVMADVTDYTCCQRGLYFRAILDWQLSELGIVEWPLTPDTFETLLRDSDLFQGSVQGWRSADISGRLDAEWIGAYALMQYLLEERGFSAELLQRNLLQSYDEWLALTELDAQDQVASWIQFVYHNSTSGQQAISSVPDPVSDLNLVCNFENNLPMLYRYDFATERWNDLAIISDDADYGLFVPMNISGAIFVLEGQESWVDETVFLTTRSYLWQDGRRYPIYDSAQDPLGEGAISSIAYPVAIDPLQRYLMLVLFTESNENTFENSLLRLVDLATCSTEGCAMIDSNLTVDMLMSPSMWSPTGEHMLISTQGDYFVGSVSESSNYPLYLADGLAQAWIPVGEGSSPFWLDGQTYGYLRIRDGGEMEIVTAVVGENEPQVLLTMPELQAALPAEIASYAPALRVNSVQPNPAFSGKLLLMAGSARGQTNASYFFILDQAGTPAQTLEYIEMQSTGGEAAFSPNGRYLQLIPYYYGNNANTGGLLLNLETGERETAVFSPDSTGFWGRNDWSQDSKWLLQQFTNYLLLYAPDSGYQRLIPLGIPDCQYAFWSSR